MSTALVENSLQILRRLLETMCDPVERRAVLLEIGRLELSRGCASRALLALVAASALAPLDRTLLLRIVTVAAEADEHFVVASTLEQLVAIDHHPHRRARVLAELARVQRDRLHDPRAALDAFARSLTEDPSAEAVEDAWLELHGGDPRALGDALCVAEARARRQSDGRREARRAAALASVRTRRRAAA